MKLNKDTLWNPLSSGTELSDLTSLSEQSGTRTDDETLWGLSERKRLRDAVPNYEIGLVKGSLVHRGSSVLLSRPEKVQGY